MCPAAAVGCSKTGEGIIASCNVPDHSIRSALCAGSPGPYPDLPHPGCVPQTVDMPMESLVPPKVSREAGLEVPLGGPGVHVPAWVEEVSPQPPHLDPARPRDAEDQAVYPRVPAGPLR